jgi:hypothetical protein
MAANFVVNETTISGVSGGNQRVRRDLNDLELDMWVDGFDTIIFDHGTTETVKSLFTRREAQTIELHFKSGTTVIYDWLFTPSLPDTDPATTNFVAGEELELTFLNGRWCDVKEQITSVGSSVIPDPYTPPDGTWNLNGDLEVSGVIKAGPANTLSGARGFVAGGQTNSVGADSTDSAIVAGDTNTISATGGGSVNAMLGGFNNTITNQEWGTVILGGEFNTAQSTTGADNGMLAGNFNTLDEANTSVIVGGTRATITGGSNLAFIGGGGYLTVSGLAATAIGGGSVVPAEGVTVNGESATAIGAWKAQVDPVGASLIGGTFNRILGDPGAGQHDWWTDLEGAIIAGGLWNRIDASGGDSADSNGCGIFAGEDHNIVADTGKWIWQAVIAGGWGGLMQGQINGGGIFGTGTGTIRSSAGTMEQDVIIGGGSQTIGGTTHGGVNSSAIVGGAVNKIQNAARIAQSMSFHGIFAGSNNTITAKDNSVILGGENNTVEDSYSAAVGGRYLTVSGVRSVILGGGGDSVFSKSTINGAFSAAIVGGAMNSIDGQGAEWVDGYGSVIVGGREHEIQALASGGSGSFSTIVGGYDCVIAPGLWQGAIFNGQESQILTENTIGNGNNTIVGGAEHFIRNLVGSNDTNIGISMYNTIVGGRYGTIRGRGSSILGGGMGSSGSGAGNANLINGANASAILAGSQAIMQTQQGSVVLGGTAGQIYESITPAPDPQFYQDGEGVAILGGINNVIDMSAHENTGSLGVWAANGILLGTDNTIITSQARLACYADVIIGGEQHWIENSWGYDGIIAGQGGYITGSTSDENDYSAYNVIVGGDSGQIGHATIMNGKHEQNAILGGRQSQLIATSGVLRGAVALGGRRLVGRHNGEVVHGYGSNGTGESQSSMVVLARITPDATPVEATTDGSAGTNENVLVLEDQSTVMFEAHVVARSTVDESAGYRLTGVIDRNTGAGTIDLVGSVTKDVIAEDVASWDVNATADTVNGSLKFEVTGEAGKTIRWTIFVRMTQVKG